MDLRISSFDFPPAKGAPQSATQVVTFPRAVREVAVGILGYATSYVGEDHHLGRLQVELAADIDTTDPTKVEVTGDFQLRDYSGTLDDSFTGNVQWALVADLVPAVPPAPGQPRPDLLIVDAELTQAVQHFRSATHLAPPHVFPDNSIRLVADKPTVVRLYVDHDAASGLPPISTLTGQLTVTSGTSTTVVLPMETIAPRRDVAILRGERRHTLNFLIPENLCRGTISINAQVRNAADATAFSPPFQRDLAFDVIPTVDIQAVGINYTGPDTRPGATPADLAAPTLGDFVLTLALTENLYPTPQVQVVSYQTMDYDEEITSDIGQGCDKFSDLLDAVSELGADDGSIVYGLYNVGVDNGTVGGCGGGGAGVGKIARTTTAAHEIGHALGRQHAPCDNVTRCASPDNQDGSYPDYSGFDSDSIGEYGFDATVSLGAVKPPSTWHDMMGYSPNKWISPYTYKALLSAIPARSASTDLQVAADRGAARREDHGEWEPIRTPHLFLRVDRSGDGDLFVDDCFTFPTFPRPRGHRPTDLTAELRTKDGRVLVCERLYAADTCGPCSPGGGCAGGCPGCVGGCGRRGPVRIRQAVAFPDDAHELVLLERRRVVHRQDIGQAPAPHLEVELAPDLTQDHLLLRWALGEESTKVRLWALVQWQDRYGVWRGVAPRTRERQLQVPKSLIAAGGFARLRVLVTTGLATASGEWEGRVAVPAPVPTGIELTGGDDRVGPRVLRASTALDARELRWYADGSEIASGRLLDTRLIPASTRRLSARAIDRRSAVASSVWDLTWEDTELTAITRFDLPVPPADRSHQHRDHHHPEEP
ncbi:M66 family metalloprotease [Nocardioides sp.]|uniref:M66 family metalloprotease n=1 Tax=Nocardioides sp. TaxID=35761 RepID=UPI003D1485CF